MRTSRPRFLLRIRRGLLNVDSYEGGVIAPEMGERHETLFLFPEGAQ